MHLYPTASAAAAAAKVPADSGDEEDAAAAAAATAAGSPADSSDEDVSVPRATTVSVTKPRIGLTIHVPHSAFPEEDKPTAGYWTGCTVKTSLGGRGDIGIHIEGEDIFTMPMCTVATWVV